MVAEVSICDFNGDIKFEFLVMLPNYNVKNIIRCFKKHFLRVKVLNLKKIEKCKDCSHFRGGGVGGGAVC